MPTSGWCSNLRLPNKLARKSRRNPTRVRDLTMRCSEPRPVLMPTFESMRTSLLARAVADLVSR